MGYKFKDASGVHAAKLLDIPYNDSAFDLEFGLPSTGMKIVCKIRIERAMVALTDRNELGDPLIYFEPTIRWSIEPIDAEPPVVPRGEC